jgi:lipoprotein-anchoring transpeptidase ErfK/SrfK
MEEPFTVATFRGSRARAWVVFIVVGLIAAGIWGAYTWRFRQSLNSGADLGSHATADAGAKDSADGATTLRAIHPLSEQASPAPQPVAFAGAATAAESGAGPGKLSPLVTPNAPPAPVQGIEVSIGAPPSPGAPGPAAAVQDVQSARLAIAGGDLIGGRVLLSKALAAGLPPADAEYARSEAGRIADALLFSRATLPDDPLATVHVLVGGESLNAIAQRNAMTEDLLAKINQITDPNRVRSGMRLKVLRGPFNAFISKADHRMDVYLGDALVRSFRVGLGTNGGTPTGTWVVKNKLQNPDWTDPVTQHHYSADDPTNPIGEHWIGLSGVEGECVGRQGFGIHGTIVPGSIGENLSMGCIRLRPEDVAFVFDLFAPNQSRVVVR